MKNIFSKEFIESNDLDFVRDYLKWAWTFKYNLNLHNKGFGDNSLTTSLRNTDLWIDANILTHPELLDFRDYVLSSLSNAGIETYPKYTYENNNHFK